MEQKRPGSKQKLIAFLTSCIFVFILIGAGELLCRYFLNINLRKTTKEFVISDASGRVTGNAPNAEGVSFGEAVYSDEFGFRIPRGFKYEPSLPAVLLIGDSVTFGVGVPEEKTFAGRFRVADPEFNIYNSSVIGFSVPDHKRFAQSFVPAHPEIKHVYLFYTLNDFQAEGDRTAPAPKPAGAWQNVKSTVAGAFNELNEFLGPRSKLYVLLTGLTIDPSSRYYELDAGEMNVDDRRFAEVLGPVIEIDAALKEKGIGFTVFLSPYEIQLRNGGAVGFALQDRLAAFFRSHGVDVVDTRERFASLANPAEGFLFADPMHLSEKGHEAVFAALDEDWAVTKGKLNK